ncbi:MAG TPA: dienelactone hydrolase family protein, partial [Dehalococcoidia bacterium]|nr:dienelactone hydrolase family protein [Dehalococcoidia bacterium]
SSAASTPAARAVIDPSLAGPYRAGTTTITWTRPSTTTGEPRELDTVIWYPAEGEPGGEALEDAMPRAGAGPFPVVIFSHGHSGGPRNAEYLTEHLASWGYVVASPPHRGNTGADCGTFCPAGTIPDSARNRVPDVEFVLDSLLALRDDPASALGAVVDPERSAIIGHSFGGWTALMAAPGGRFDAIVGLAPATTITGLAAEQTRVPVLLIASGQDELIPIAEIDKAWLALPEGIGKVYVELPEGGHTSYIGRCIPCPPLGQERAKELVRRYVTAFLQVHIAGDARYAEYLAAAPPDAVLRQPPAAAP